MMRLNASNPRRFRSSSKDGTQPDRADAPLRPRVVVEQPAASEQLGHSSSRITSRFYVPVKIDRSDFSSRLDALGGGAQAS